MGAPSCAFSSGRAFMNSTNFASLTPESEPRISSNNPSFVFFAFLKCSFKASKQRPKNIAPVKSSLVSPMSGAAAALALSILASKVSNIEAASLRSFAATIFCSRSLIAFFCLSRSACSGPTLTSNWLNSACTEDSPAFMSLKCACSALLTAESWVCASCCALRPLSTAMSISLAASSPSPSSAAEDKPSAKEIAILTASSAAPNFAKTSSLALTYFLSATSFLTASNFCCATSVRVCRASNSSVADFATLSAKRLEATRFTASMVFEPVSALVASFSASFTAAATASSFSALPSLGASPSSPPFALGASSVSPPSLASSSDSLSRGCIAWRNCSTAASDMATCFSTSATKPRDCILSAFAFISFCAVSTRSWPAFTRSCSLAISSSGTLFAFDCISKYRITPFRATFALLALMFAASPGRGAALAVALAVGLAEGFALALGPPGTTSGGSSASTVASAVGSTLAWAAASRAAMAWSTFSSTATTLDTTSSTACFSAICFSTAGGNVLYCEIFCIALRSRCCNLAKSALSLSSSAFLASIWRMVSTSWATCMTCWASK
mmetsp:Transcript_6676/g.24973  ORF Transcript_6676/g.24973 Transcript_6676/m.24973 type:complete len:558 (+) Transcript_6676:2563-4236(+)